MDQLSAMQTRVAAVGRKRHQAARGAVRVKLHEVAATLVPRWIQINDGRRHCRPRVEVRPERRAASGVARVVAPEESRGWDEVVSVRTPRNPSTDLECALRYLTRKHRVLLRESVDRVLAVRELYVGGAKRFDLVRRENLWYDSASAIVVAQRPARITYKAGLWLLLYQSLISSPDLNLMLSSCCTKF